MCSKIGNVSEGSSNVVDLIINTPRSKQGWRGGYEIRRAAVDFGVPYITTIHAAKAVGAQLRLPPVLMAALGSRLCGSITRWKR